MSTINERIAQCIDALGIKKTTFADRINVSQAFVSQLVKGVSQPSDRTISDICREFNVNRDWLEKGEGDEMFIKLSRSDEISAFIGEILSGDIDFRGRLVAALAKLSPEQWKLLEQVADNLMEEMQKEKPGQ